MKRNAMWMAAGLLSVATIWWTPACTSNEGTAGEDPTGNEKDAGSSSTDGASNIDDSSTESPDASKGDASTTDPDGGEIDPFVEACARIDACATPTGPRIGMNGCYELLTAAPFARQLRAQYRVQLENLECKLAATTCAAVRACDRPNADYVALCQHAEGGEHCDGNVHVVCDDNTFEPVLAVDCAATGNICGQNGFIAGCGKAPCVQGETATSCNGDTLTECSSANVTLDVDCKTASTMISRKPNRVTIAGTTCGIDNMDFAGQSNCIGDGAACTSLSSRCDGTVLETCAGGYIARRDCAKILPAGQGCTVLEDGPMTGTHSCGPINPTCHASDNETCNPTTGVIGFCALTETKTVDCKAIGYAGCKTTTVNGRVTAACFQ